MNAGVLWLAASLAAVVLAAAARIAFLRVSLGSAVDHFYWTLAARAYRTRTGLPVRIPGKFLLEDERQAYPPGFGVLMAALPDRILTSPRGAGAFVVGVDVVTLALLLAAAFALGIGPAGLVAVLLVYGLAPVLVAYNTQLTSRGVGNLLLTVSLLLQAGAAAASDGSAALATASALLGVVALAATILTHKMTTQFAIVLWPAWILALAPLGPAGVWIAALSPPLALLAATAATGRAFQLLQWRAHWDIVSFWHRNWKYLGAHQFRQSPLYGDAERRAPGAFHAEGLVGVRRHLALVAGYLPVALPLPATLLLVPPPPAFVIAWCAAAYVAALATLLVGPLRCLGGGHLYLFNAVPAAALWWGWTLSHEQAGLAGWLLFGVGMILTLASLAAGLHKRRGRRGATGDDFDALLARLAELSPTRIAAFPVTATERIALETPHAVFWGGHGLGFRKLEPYWPVMRERLGPSLRAWGITHAVLDASWWPEGEAVFAAETGDAAPRRIGRFLVYAVADPDRGGGPAGDPP